MMYTFDNTFQVSFLFRDGISLKIQTQKKQFQKLNFSLGCIAFVKDEEGMPAVKPLEDALKPPKPTEMVSFTSTLSIQSIQKFIKKYKIREPLLKINRD